MAASELLLSRVRAVLVTGAVGAVVSHVWLPWGPGASRAERIGFAALMFVVGTGFGAIDARVRGVHGRASVLQAGLFGALVVAVSAAAYALLHGPA